MIYRIVLFLSSYTLLWFILWAKFCGSDFAWACLGLGIVSVAALAFWLFWGYRQNGNDFDIEVAENAGAEAAGYLASYLLPFFNVDTPTRQDLIVYAGFFITAALIFVRSNIMRINPTLYVAGYWILQITDETGSQRFLITRKNVVRGDRIKAVDMGGDILLLKSIETEA